MSVPEREFAQEHIVSARKLISRMPEDLKSWYDKNMDSARLQSTIANARIAGYEFDPDSGLLFRPVFNEDIIKRLGYTLLDIVFTRPADLHYHTDVDEAVAVLAGKGEVRFRNDPEKSAIREDVVELSRGKEIYVPCNKIHAFRPEKNDLLEIRLACSGILDPENEVCVEKFDQYQPWVEYYFEKKND